MGYNTDEVINMATKAQLEGNKRYQEKLDRMVFYVGRGAKDKIKEHAAQRDLSVNAYIVSLIEADMGKLFDE